MGNPGRWSRARAKLAAQAVGEQRLTKLRAEAMQQTQTEHDLKVSKLRAKAAQKIVYTNPATLLDEGTYFTKVRASVMRTRTPNFEWIEMFINEEFPHDISYNSLATTGFSTDVTLVDSGHTQRTKRWQYPLMSYNVAYGIRTMEHLFDLVAFFRVMEGQTHAFLYRDVMDHTSSIPVKYEARKAPPITMLDQWLGDGDGDTFVWQLRKGYTVGSVTRWRPIHKPMPGTIAIAWDDVEYTHWVANTDTGKITFLERAVLQPGVYTGTIEVDVQATNRVRFIGEVGMFDAFIEGDRVTFSGFVAPANNSLSTQRVFILDKAEDGSWIDVDRPDGFGDDETPGSTGRIATHPAPPEGTVVKAGYKFWVPVRFTVDEISTSLEDYGVGGGQNVKLMEVRPWETS